MNTSVDLLRSFAASVCLTLGLARLAEKLDPSALAAGAGLPGDTAATYCVSPCRVPGEALLRTCMLSMPCEAPVRATVQPSVPCVSCGTACNVPVRHAAA